MQGELRSLVGDYKHHTLSIPEDRKQSNKGESERRDRGKERGCAIFADLKQ